MRFHNNVGGDIEMEEVHGLLNDSNSIDDADSFADRRHRRKDGSNMKRSTVTSNNSSNGCGTCCATCTRLILILLIVFGVFSIGQYSIVDNYLDMFNNNTDETDSSSGLTLDKITITNDKQDEESGSEIVEVEEVNKDGDKEIEEILEQKDEKPKEEPPKKEQPLNDETKEDINSIEKWGKWKFYDGGKDTRPNEDYCSNYTNRDIPGSKFPMNAWQTDAVYVNHFINEGMNLIQRVQEAILTEYGHDKKPNMKPEELVKRREMFELTFLNDDLAKEKIPTNAGATTKKSFNGLVKRLLHAMMTNDTFTIVLGGHSAAAGHGNHFKQSYMMQFFYIMEPIFERLGMKLVVRNISQGGLGTMQGALGSKDIYGDEVDIIVWDSSMTEKSNPAYELFARQALLQKRAPILYNGMWDIQKRLFENIDADIFYMGNGYSGIKQTVDEEQMLTLPFASRGIICDGQRNDLCNGGYKYRTKCWVDRPDVTPTTPQDAHIGSQVGWHPGFRSHQLTGRLMSFVLLSAIENALSIWSETTIVSGHPLDDDFWHVTDHYNNIHAKLDTYSDDKDGCESLNNFFPSRICNLPLNGRTEFQPRANPVESSILSIVRSTSDNDQLKYPELLYDGLDVYNPAIYDLPDGAIDVHAIGSARRTRTRRGRHLLRHQRQQSLIYGGIIHDFNNKKHNLQETNNTNNDDNTIVPGNWIFFGAASGICGGEYYDICGREDGNKCLLSGHGDRRGGILGDSSSGWLIMDLPIIAKTKGIIIIKIENWHGQKLDGTWLCNDLLFDYSINGKMTTLNKEEIVLSWTNPERTILLLTLLDDEEFVKGLPKESIEVALRWRGCTAQETRILLTHVYWA